MDKIRIAIVGYGNLGKSAELGINENQDMKLVAVFTRRDPSSINTLNKEARVYKIEDAQNMRDEIDVAILCGGSKSDIPEQGPYFASLFNTVDGFDTHAKIPEYFEEMDKIADTNKHISIISTGWDPGMFSINRLMGSVILPQGKDYTFWGRGVSQGHSDAIRRIDGVKNAVEYTIPADDAIKAVRNGENPNLTIRQKHIRECFVVAQDEADKEKIEHQIITMPNYFADYNTIVHFITQDELIKNHSRMPHGGFVITSGKTGVRGENSQIIEYSLKLESNPDFTANILLAYARAAYRLNKEGVYGAKTVFDIAPSYLSIKSNDELRKDLL